MMRNRIGILFSVFMAASGALARAQAPPAGSKAGPVAAGHSQVPAPPTFGTSVVTFQSIPASDFDPDTACASACTDYSSTWNPALNNYAYRRYVTGGQPRLFASPRLPPGALVSAIQYRYCDFNGSGSGRLTFNVYICNHFSECDSTPYHTYTSLAGQGCAAVLFDLPPHTVDNLSESILIEAGWGVSDDTLQLGGVSLGYKLQVSPPPEFATFSDVLPDNPFFQYVEAFAAAGITGGCGGGQYCPNNFVTRAQMAVFFAKALGLQW